MELFVSFVLSVAAGVVSNCISKWLDGKHKDSKHSQMEEPPWSCNSEGVLLCLLSFAAAVKPLANVIGNHICSDSHKKIDEDVAHMTHLLSVARMERAAK